VARRTIRESIRASIRSLKTEMAASERDALPASAFVFPDRRAWPIHDRKHGQIALAFIAQGKGDAADYPAVRAAVAKKYPDLVEGVGRNQAEAAGESPEAVVVGLIDEAGSNLNSAIESLKRAGSRARKAKMNQLAAQIENTVATLDRLYKDKTQMGSIQALLNTLGAGE